MALDPFEEPKKKSGDALALALANMGGVGSTAVDAGSAATSLPFLLQAMLGKQQGGSTPSSSSSWAFPSDAGWAGDPAPGVFGQMTPDERSTLGGIKNGISLGNLGLSLGGIATGPLGAWNTAVLGGILGWDALGLNAGIRGVTQYSPTELQSLADRFGYQMPGSNPSPASDPTATGIGGYNYGDLSYGNMPGMDGQGGGGGGGGIGAGDTGGGGAGGGGYGGGGEAQGGVHRTRPGQSMTSTWGETGQPETAIFIPEMMKQPGLQGNERQVRSALMRAILSLR